MKEQDEMDGPRTGLRREDFVFLRQHSYRLRRVISSGAYGAVVKAEDTAADRALGISSVAIKVIRLTSLSSYERQLIRREVDFLTNNHHKNIMEFRRVLYRESSTIYIVTEYLRGGDLLARLRKGGLLSELTVAEVARQLASALVYMERVGWAHRDIKLENVVFAGNPPQEPWRQNAPFTVKLVDFGYAVRVADFGLRGIVGTRQYMAPEAMREDSSPYDLAKGDCWSLGVVLYALVCGKFPFHGETDADISKMVYQSKVKFTGSSWDYVSKPVKELIRDLLKKDPKRRPSAKEVLARSTYLSTVLEPPSRPQLHRFQPDNARWSSLAASGRDGLARSSMAFARISSRMSLGVKPRKRKPR